MSLAAHSQQTTGLLAWYSLDQAIVLNKDPPPITTTMYYGVSSPKLVPTSSHICYTRSRCAVETFVSPVEHDGIRLTKYLTKSDTIVVDIIVMTHFSSLPLEVVICIVQSAEDNTDLRALCTVSKVISAIAQPLLYYEIDLEDCDTVQGALSLFLLTRTITNSQEIAGWIQCLRIDAVTTCGCDYFFLGPYGQIPRWKSEGKYTPYEDEVKNFSIAVDRLEEIYDISEFLTTSNSKPNVLVALLVSCTTNLTDLTIHVNRNSLALLSALGQQSAAGYSCLSKIESLCLTGSAKTTPKDEMNFDSVTPLLLLLPKLNRVWISGCFGAPKSRLDDIRSKRSTKLLLPLTLPITHLSFAKSCLTATNLQALISACKDLNVFSFTNRRKSYSQDQQFSPVELYSALDCQKSNLQDLRVCLETDSLAQAFDWDGSTYGSFQECTRLKFLELDERFLGLPPAGLPDSLEYLVLQNCQSSIFDLLSYLAALVLTGTELTSLRTISVYAHILFPGGMLGLPLNGATDLMFNKAQRDLVALFLGTEVSLRFESGLLEKTYLGYEVASEHGYIGDYGPFVYTENPMTGSEIVLK
ncbi:hypothetical protein DPV78_006539 [Talaromyces pinophilus]|nr:hypothetical protein DPV78_006539 [Talaromyces pinophilus]